MIRPTTKDVTRAVDALTTGEGDVYERVQRVANALAYTLGRGSVRLDKITTRDARLLLVAHGADSHTADQYGRAVAARVRAESLAAGSSFGAWI